MQASRVLLSTSTAVTGFRIPPRTSLDIFKSAASASWSILWSQEKRDQFVDTLKKGVISPEVLTQADHGPALVLALFHDLDSPLFSKYKFDAEEFSQGVKPALEQFYNVQGNLTNTLYKDDETGTPEETEEGKEEEGNDETESDKDEQSSKNESIKRVVESFGGIKGEKERLASFLKVKSDTKVIERLLKETWVKDAEEEPESLAGQLMKMVTPDYFGVIRNIAWMKCITGQKWLYQDGSSEINNVALLSARAVVLNGGDDEKSTDGDNATSDKVRDEELEVKEENDDGIAEDAQVVAQVEVLYDISRTFESVEKPAETSSNDNEKEKEEETEDAVAKQSVWVGVFEGWLNGNPDGTSDLRWKLVLNRPPWEFPSLHNSYYES